MSKILMSGFVALIMVSPAYANQWWIPRPFLGNTRV